jgi:hypothetical protein
MKHWLIILFFIIPITVEGQVGDCTPFHDEHDDDGDDTEQIQWAFDNCGTVTMDCTTPPPSGRTFYMAQVQIKAGVTWDLNGCTIETIDDKALYDPFLPCSEPYCTYPTIWASNNTNNVTIKGLTDQPATSIIKRVNSFGMNPTIKVKNGNGWVLRDFTIDSEDTPGGSGHGGFHLSIRSDSDNLTIDKVIITGQMAGGSTGTDGYHVDGDNVTIVDGNVKVFDDAMAIGEGSGNWSVSDTWLNGRIRYARDLDVDITNLTFTGMTFNHTNHPRRTKKDFRFAALAYIVGGRGSGENWGDMRDITYNGITLINGAKLIHHKGDDVGLWEGQSYDLTIKNVAISGVPVMKSVIHGVRNLWLDTFTGSATTIDINNVCGLSIYPATPIGGGDYKIGNVTLEIGNDVTYIRTDGLAPSCGEVVGELDHFNINNVSSPQDSGTAFNITIYAKDENENTVTSFTGTVDIDDIPSKITPTVSGSFTSGTKVQSVTVDTSYTNDRITVTNSAGSETGQSNFFNVTGAPPPTIDHFHFNTISSPKTQGVSFPITIAAHDAGHSVITSFTGTVNLTDLSTTIDPVVSGSFTSGTWTGSVTINAVYSNDTITATGVGKNGTSNTFNVIAPPERILKGLIIRTW